MTISWKNNYSNTSSDLVLTIPNSFQSTFSNSLPKLSLDLLQPLRQWLDQIEIHNPKIARILSNVIPAQCPFERNIVLLGRKLGHIPPLCKLNPLYDQLVGLRFRALCFLAEHL